MRGPDGKGPFNTRKNSGGGGSVTASKQNAHAPVRKTPMRVRVMAPSPLASPLRTIRLPDGPLLQGELQACHSWDPASQFERRNSLRPDFPAHTSCRRIRRLRAAIFECPPAQESQRPSSESAAPSLARIPCKLERLPRSATTYVRASCFQARRPSSIPASVG